MFFFILHNFQVSFHDVWADPVFQFLTLYGFSYISIKERECLVFGPQFHLLVGIAFLNLESFSYCRTVVQKVENFPVGWVSWYPSIVIIVQLY